VDEMIIVMSVKEAPVSRKYTDQSVFRGVIEKWNRTCSRK
jgi:hypothetical protein